MPGRPPRRPRSSTPARSARDTALAEWRGIDWAALEKARTVAAKPIGSLLPDVLERLGLERKRAETEVLRVWNHTLDPHIVAHAQPTGLRNGTLFVTVDSHVWLHEIVRYRRREILDRLQHSFGLHLIARISFRVG